MKTLYSFCLLLSILGRAQTTPTIRFVYWGEELKPHGTLVISVNKRVIPTDRPLDSLYGVSCLTDEATFDFVDSFIRKNVYTSSTLGTPAQHEGAFAIVIPWNTKFYLHEKQFEPFFRDLREGLRKAALDKKIIKEFENYWEWR